jgi:hypothetical protein
MNYRHGLKRDRIYCIWKQMKNKCYNPNNNNYHRYGGRGIKVCDIWLEDPVNFYLWATDTGFKDGLMLCLIDESADFSPWNCRWRTKEEFHSTKRPAMQIEIDGVSKSLKEWSEVSGIKYPTIQARYRKGFRGKDLIQPLMK